MLVTSRCFAEYEAMFDLHGEDLVGLVLDCCAGASSFAAELADRGGRALALDPAYAETPTDLRAAAHAGLGLGNQIIDVNSDAFVWDWYGEPEHRDRLRAEAVARFLEDLARHPSRYLAAELPRLSLRDRAVDLVLCSHLLFTWCDRLGLEWHRTALAELLRVAGREVRVFPLVRQGAGEPVSFLGTLVDELRGHGFHVSLRRVPYRFQRTGDTMLVVGRGG